MNVKVFTRLRGIFLLKWAVCCLLLCGAHIVHAQSFYFFNDGAVISVKPATPFIIKSSTGDGGVLRNGGYLSNESDIIIEGSFENHTLGDTAVGVGPALFHVSKDWTNNGTFEAGQSTVFLNGVDQQVKGSVPTPFYNLTLEGSGIKTLRQNASVSGVLTLNDRELATDTSTMTVLNTDSAAITRTTGFVSSLHGGTLERAMDNDTTRYYYPLGSSLNTPRYRPLVIQSTDTAYTLIGARLGNTDASSDGYDRNNRSSDICGINPNFYHQIERTGNTPVNITMFYNPLEDGLWSQISHWQNVPRWELAGLSIETVDSLYTSLTLNNWDNFSPTPFALMAPSTLLDDSLTVITHVTCNGGSDGSICVGYPPITGTPPFHYQWSTAPTVDTTACIVNLPAGTYTLSITDAFNCPNIYTFEVEEPAPVVTSVDIKHVSCNGFADGEACVTATRGTETFTYRWVDFADSNCHTGLSANTYAITVTDTANCITVAIAAVTEPDELVATAEAINVSCYGFGDGQGVANVTGGTIPYSYLWSDSSVTETLDGLIPQTYSVTVTDSNGCTATSAMDIIQPDSLIVTAGNDTATFTGYSVTLYVAYVTGGNGNETYQWTPAESVADPQNATTAATPDDDTPYVVTVTDAKGCIAIDTLVVQVDENLYTFPDGFVPNGQNNIFMPVMSSTVTVLKLEIFNRWGQLVGNDPGGWDGKYNGELQPMDTYVYQAVLKLPDQTEKKERGDFILIW